MLGFYAKLYEVRVNGCLITFEGVDSYSLKATIFEGKLYLYPSLFQEGFKTRAQRF